MGLVLVLLALGLRVAVGAMLPGWIEDELSELGFQASFGRSRVSLATLEVELSHVELLPGDGAASPRVALEYLRVDVSLLDLLLGDLTLNRAEVDGLEVALHRLADGTIVLPAPLREAFAADDVSAPDPGPRTPEEPVDVVGLLLEPPLRVDSLRLQEIELAWRDDAVDPPMETLVQLGLRLSDVGSTSRTARAELRVSASGLADRVQVKLDADPREGVLGLDLQVNLNGLQPGPAAGWLEPLGITSTVRKLDAELAGHVDLALRGPPVAQVALGPLDVYADGDPAASLMQLAGSVDLTPLLPGEGGPLRLGDLVLRGVRGGAALDADGSLRSAGLRFASSSSDDEPDDGSGAPLVVTVDRARVEDVELTLLDGTVTPPAPLVLGLHRIEVTDVSTDLASATPSTRLELELSSPGLVERVALTASLDPRPDGGEAELQLALTGIDPVVVAPRLRALGLETRMSSGGELTLALENVWRLSDQGLSLEGRLHDVAITHDDGTSRLGELAWSGVDVGADGSRIDLAQVTLTGLEAEVVVLDDGRVRLPGLDLLPAPPTAAASSSAPAQDAAPAPAASEPGPHLRIASVHLLDERLAFTAPGRPRTEVSDLDVLLNGLELPPGELPSLERLSLQASLAELVDRVEVEAQALNVDGGIQVRATLRARGLHPAQLVELPAEGPRIDFDDGSVSVDLSARVMGDLAAPRIELELSDLALVHEGQVVFGLDALRVAGLSQTDDGVNVESVLFASPRAAVEREADGSLSLPGLRLPVVAAVVGDAPDAPVDPAASVAPVAAVTPAPTDADLPALRLGRLGIEGLLLSITDRTVDVPVEEQLRLDLALQDLVLGADVAPAPFEFTLSGPGGARTSLKGPITPSVERPAASLVVESRGLDLTLIGPYLPPEVSMSLTDGRLDARLDVGIEPVAAGGHRLAASLDGFSIRDGDAEPMASWDRLGITASRLDTDARVYEFEELAFTGLSLEAGRDEDGSLYMPGLTIRPGASAAVAGEGGGAAPAATPRRAAGSRRELPRIGLERLDIRFDDLTWTGPGRVPLTLRDFSVENTAPMMADGDERPDAMGLLLKGGLPPLVDAMTLRIAGSPFDQQPSVAVELGLDGFRGPALHEVVPELDGVVDARDLEEGRLRLSAVGMWTGRRRHAYDFDTQSGASLELGLFDVSLEDLADDQVLLELESLEVDVRSGFGADGSLVIDSVEMAQPLVRISKTARGLELAEVILLRQAEPPPSPSPAPVPPPVLEEAAEEAAPERTIRRLLLAGADLVYRDETVDPPMVLPIVGLDIDARNLSTRLLTEEQPVTFTVLAQGGVPALDDPESASAPQASVRPVFEEVRLDGRLVLHPQLTGRVRAEVQAFDVLSVKGPAAQNQVVLRSGVVDAWAETVFKDNGDMSVKSLTRVTDLDLSEPAGGPIESVLRLPSPTGSVLFLLRNKNGQIDLPLEFDVPADGLTTRGVSSVAATALGGLITRAAANAPFRVVGGITDTVGGITNTMGGMIGVDLGLGGGEERTAGDPVRLVYGAGGTTLQQGEEQLLDALCERLDDEPDLRLTLRHRIGLDDMALLEGRANPPAAWVQDLALRMRVRRTRLELDREALSERVRAMVASGLYERAVEPTEDLAVLDVEIGLLERSLDALLEATRPGSARLADRRAQAMAGTLAQLRLAELAEALRQRLDDDDFERVRVLPPRVSRKPSDEKGSITLTPSFDRAR